MSNVASLIKRIDTLLSAIERKQQQQERICTVLLCNASGEPLPGPESEQARKGTLVYLKRIILSDVSEDGIA